MSNKFEEYFKAIANISLVKEEEVNKSVKQLMEIYGISEDEALNLIKKNTVTVGQLRDADRFKLKTDKLNMTNPNYHIKLNQSEIIIKEQNDGRNDVTNKTIENLIKTMYEQDDYGMDKYKEPLHHSYNYDWMKMFQQEIADGLKYLQNEIDRKEEVKQILLSARLCNSMSEKNRLINTALSLLNAGGRENKDTK